MVIYLAVCLVLLIFIKLSMSMRSLFRTASEGINSTLTASRFSSGKVTYKEMEARDIHPYFCSREQMVIWVEQPAPKERCPSCGESIYSIYIG